MLKVIMLLFSFCSSIINNVNSTFELISSFNDNINKEDEIIGFNSGFYLKKEGTNYTIFNKNINLSFQKFPIYKIYNNSLYVSIYDESMVYIFVYDQNGLLINEFNMTLTVDNIIDIIFINEKVYAIGNINGLKSKNGNIYNDKTIVIIDFENEDYILLGSEKYEEVVDAVYNENLYLLFKKEKITNGELGNGGKYDRNLGIVMLDNNFNVIRVNVFEIDIILENNYSLFTKKDYILLKTNNNIYKFNKQTKFLDKLFLSGECVIGENIIAVFDKEEIYLYDIYYFNEHTILKNDLKEKNIYFFESNILIKNNGYYNVDIADYRLFKCFEKYHEEIDDKNSVYTLFGKAELINEECESYFTDRVVGSYNFELTYRSINDLIFSKNVKQEIDLEVNVSEGMVYPSGYRIIFNGYGKLNDESVVSNHPIYNEGEYELYILGNNYESTINFIISDGTNSYNDIMYNNIDYYYTYEDEVVIELYEEEKEDYEIQEIVSNYKINEINIKKNPGRNNIIINFGLLPQGKHYIYIEKIIIVSDAEVKEIIINKYFSILIYENVLNYELSDFNHENMKITVNSFDNSCRALEVIVTTNEISKNYYYLIDTNIKQIDLFDLKNNISNIEIYIIYYSGFNYQGLKVCDISISGYQEIETIGTLYKNTNDDSDKRISIDFSKGQDVIEKINIDNKLVYVKEDKMDLKTIVIGIIIGVFCFLVIVYVKRKKKMKLD